MILKEAKRVCRTGTKHRSWVSCLRPSIQVSESHARDEEEVSRSGILTLLLSRKRDLLYIVTVPKVGLVTKMSKLRVCKVMKGESSSKSILVEGELTSENTRLAQGTKHKA